MQRDSNFEMGKVRVTILATIQTEQFNGNPVGESASSPNLRAT